MTGGHEIRETVVQVEVTMMPAGTLDALTWSITVQWRGDPGRYAVMRHRRCLTPGGGWHYDDPDPDGDCVQHHRYSMAEAVVLAREYLPLLVVDGRTSAQVLDEVADGLSVSQVSRLDETDPYDDAVTVDTRDRT
jgi:hypothetical protein